MYRPPKGISRRYYTDFCGVACSSKKDLSHHLHGIRHQTRFYESSKKAEENSFPLEHMVVLDQTEEDLTSVYAASPASCDSSDSELAASVSVNIPRSHMIILDETNDDTDHPASPASCHSSASESAPLSPATVQMSDVTPKKKRRSKMPEDEYSTSVSPLSVLSIHSSSNFAPEAEAVPGTSEKSTSKKSPAKSSKTRRKKSKKTFHIEPVKSNQEVFQFLKTFAIASESDVAFSEKVKKMFSNALKKYEERKLEEMLCTEAEHGFPEELMESTDGPSNHEETNSSIPQATNKNDCEIINSAPGSPATLSPTQCIITPTSTGDYQQDSTIINQSTNSDTSSIASKTPTSIYEDIDTSSKLSAAHSRNDNPCSTTDADLLMKSDTCVLAEAACSDDDYV